MKKILLDTLKSSRASLRNSTNYARSPRGFVLIPLLIVCFALLPGGQATPEEGPATPATPQEASTAPEIPANLNPRVMQLPTTPDPGSVGGSFNTADGQNALASVITGSANTAVGWFALFSNAENSFNTATGAGALLFNTADNNTAFGAAALLFNTTAANNTAVGTAALLNNNAVENTAIGHEALNANTSGNDNAAGGLFALFNNVDGSSNTAFGTAALRDNVSGGNNQAFGRGALRFTTGSNNIGIGREAGTNMTTGDNVISIGSLGDGTAFTASDRCFIGNIRGVVVGNLDGIPVIVDSDGQLGTSNSSRRFKKDIQPMERTSEAILALKPVTFHYKDADTKKAENTPQFGLIAEDVAEVNPDLVVLDGDGEPLTVRYDAVNAMLLNEFLKEHKKVEEQQTNITQLNSKMANQAAIIAQQQKGMEVLTAQFKEQAAQIQKVSAQLEVNKPAAKVVSHEQ
jgi:hypothetical protein